MERRVAVRIHHVHNRSLSLLLLVGRKMGGRHERKSLPGSSKVGKVEAESLGLNLGFDARILQLLEKGCRIGQRTGPNPGNRRWTGKLAGGLLKADDVTLVGPAPNGGNEPPTGT